MSAPAEPGVEAPAEAPVPPPAKHAAAWRWAAAAVLAAAAAWSLDTVGRTVSSGRWWLWNGVDVAPPVAYALVPPALLVPALVVRRLRRYTLPLLAVALLLGAGQSGLHPAALLRSSGPVPPGALRVVSWDTFFWDQHNDPDRFYSYLASRDADVYLLQEYEQDVGGKPEPVDDLARLKAAFPGYHVAVAGEFLTLSRYPVTLTRALRPAGLPAPDSDWADYWNVRALRTDIAVHGTTLSLYNVHLPDLFDVDRIPVTPGYYRTVGEFAHRRALHLAALRADLRADPDPVVLGGDLNTLPGSHDLASFHGLRDTADSGTSLYPATFPARAPLWRFDWTFASPRITVHRQELSSPPGGLSTHRLIQLALSLPDREPAGGTSPDPKGRT